MAIDEKGLKAAHDVLKFRGYEEIMSWCVAEAIEAYEAAKEAGQPDERTIDLIYDVLCQQGVLEATANRYAHLIDVALSKTADQEGE